MSVHFHALPPVIQEELLPPRHKKRQFVFCFWFSGPPAGLSGSCQEIAQNVFSVQRMHPQPKKVVFRVPVHASMPPETSFAYVFLRGRVLTNVQIPHKVGVLGIAFGSVFAFALCLCSLPLVVPLPLYDAKYRSNFKQYKSRSVLMQLPLPAPRIMSWNSFV